MEKLNPELKKYYELIVKKDAEKIVDSIPAYRKKQEEKKQTKQKLMHFLTESKVVGRLYKTLLGR